MYTCTGGAGAWLLLLCGGGRLRMAAECSGMLPDVVAKPRGRSSMKRNAAAMRCRTRQASSSSHANAPPVLLLPLKPTGNDIISLKSLNKIFQLTTNIITLTLLTAFEH